MRVVHSYIARGWYISKNATAILLGTFPSVLIREAFGRIRPDDVDFFYGSRDNNFWRDLAVIYGCRLDQERTDTAIRQRMQLLDDLSLGLSDAIFACHTLGSAMDTALHELELNTQLVRDLDSHPAVSRLYFTSSSGKVNAETLTLRMLRQEGRLSGMKILQERGPKRRQFLFRSSTGPERPIETITLYSPSPLAEQWGALTAEKRRAQYRAWLPARNTR
ncbi:uracil-DNA glycosylase family protein [Flaviaesturariibacter terrae]